MMITPFVPRTPYPAVDAASRNTFTVDVVRVDRGQIGGVGAERNAVDDEQRLLVTHEGRAAAQPEDEVPVLSTRHRETGNVGQEQLLEGLPRRMLDILRRQHHFG